LFGGWQDGKAPGIVNGFATKNFANQARFQQNGVAIRLNVKRQIAALRSR